MALRHLCTEFLIYENEMENIGRMITGEREKNPENFDIVHHKYHSADNGIVVVISQCSSHCAARTAWTNITRMKYQVLNFLWLCVYIIFV